MDSFVNTSVEKSSELLASETVDSPADNVPPAPYRLFNRQKTIHEVFGGGMVADVMLWRKRGICIGVFVAATAAWYLFERSRYTFLSLISTILLLLVAILFIWANAASLLQRSLPPLPELELSEETVNKVAASMCVRINDVLAVAHDIALGKDIKLFAKAVIFLWLFSIFGGWCNFFTLVYIAVFVKRQGKAEHGVPLRFGKTSHSFSSRADLKGNLSTVESGDGSIPNFLEQSCRPQNSSFLGSYCQL